MPLPKRFPSFWICVWLATGACGGGPALDSSSGLRITHGPILGGVDAGSVAVWVRTSEPGEFHVFYGVTLDALDGSVTGSTGIGRDNSGHVKIEGLASNTKYYYEATVGRRPEGVERLSGYFHTLPSPSGAAHSEVNPEGLFNFAFEFACGNNQNPRGSGSAFGPALPTYATMQRELLFEDRKSRIDFAVLNGDWLYEEEREYTPGEWAAANGVPEDRIPRPLQVMPTLAGVWENYKLYLSRGTNLADWHRRTPSYFVVDDHEILNDNYGSGEVGFVDRRAVFRDIGFNAWYDYLGWSSELEVDQDIVYGRASLSAGSDRLEDPEADFSALDLDGLATLHVHWGTPDAGVMLGPSDTEGGDPNAKVYEVVDVIDSKTLRIRPPAQADGMVSYSIGRRSYWNKRVSNAELFFLDTRTYREMHDVEDRWKQGLTMLGTHQKAWLRETMAASDASIFFVFSSVNFMIPHIGGTGDANISLVNKDDAWTVFLEEREELIRFWDSLGKPVFVLTGDLHNSFAIKVTGRVWEFASGPHNSANHPLSSEGNRPTNGTYDSFGREAEIRWSTFLLPDTPNGMRKRPVYCVARVNNVFDNPKEEGETRWVAYAAPQVTFTYYDGLTGDQLYAESIIAR